MRGYLLSVCIFIGLIGTTFAQRNYSLQQAIDEGLQNNKDFKLQEIDLAVAEAQIKELRATGLPQVTGTSAYQYYYILPKIPFVDGTAAGVTQILNAYNVDGISDREIPPIQTQKVSFNRPNTINGQINASWLIFDGSYLVALQASRMFRELTAHNRKVSEQKVKNEITKAYLNVLLTDINKKTLDDNIKNLTKIRYETQEIYNQGFVEQLDIDRLDLSLMNLKLELEKLDNVADVTKNVLKLYMGVPVSEEITLTEDVDAIVNVLKIESVNLEEELDVTELPEYKQIEYGAKMQELNMKQLDQGKLPQVVMFSNLGATLQRDNLFDNDETGWLPSGAVGVQVNVPIYDGKGRASKVEKAQLQINKTKVQMEQFADAKQLELSNAKLNFINAQKTLLTSEKALEITQNIYDKTRIKYNEGVGSSIEVAQAEGDVYNAQANYINAVYNLVNAKADIDIALGK